MVTGAERSGDRICLRNCPYDALVAGHRDVTCGMNLAWAEGLVDGLTDVGMTARLAPADGYCCVVLVGRPSDRARAKARGDANANAA